MNKILVIDDISTAAIERLEAAGFVCDYQPNWKSEEVLAAIGGYRGVILRSKILANKAFIDAGVQLRFIGRVGAGMETIDIPYANSKGIVCLNSPEGNRDAVGEQAIGMLLALMNNLMRANQQVRQLVWDREGNRGIELKGRTVGIIGYGNMGGAFARKLSGFECEVLAYDKYRTLYSDRWAREASLNEIFEHADVVSFHVPQTEETIAMVNDEFLSKFKKPIIVINTARGKVVKTADLVKHIKAGSVFGACLDVLEYESFNFQDFLHKDMSPDFDYLTQSDRVVLSPHIAGWTVESKFKLSDVLVSKIIELFQ